MNIWPTGSNTLTSSAAHRGVVPIVVNNLDEQNLIHDWNLVDYDYSRDASNHPHGVWFERKPNWPEFAHLTPPQRWFRHRRFRLPTGPYTGYSAAASFVLSNSIAFSN